MKLYRHTIASIVTVLTTALFLNACSDPADDKEVAVVKDALEVNTAATKDGEESIAVVAEGTVYTMDNDESSITFTGSKPTGTHSGGWSGYVGTVTVPDGDFARATIIIDFDMNSTYSDDKDLTDTLKSDKMFDVEKHPDAKFVSTSIAETSDGYDVSGNLTLHGITKNLTFSAEVELDDKKVIAESEFSINRKDFDINYDGLVGDLIREKVVMLFYIEANVD
ncbi:MAG: YceI family protein [Candidatus Hydrogenedentota bacterium]